MKKVSLVVMDKTRKESLEKLRDLGVIHIEKRSVSSPALSGLLERKTKIETALGILRPYEAAIKMEAKRRSKDTSGGNTQNPKVSRDSHPNRRASDFINPEGVPFSTEAVNGPDREDLNATVLKYADERKNLQERFASLSKERNRIEGWGNFDPEDLKLLAERGIVFILYELTQKAFAALPPDTQFIILNKDKAVVRVIVLGKELAGETPFALPGLSIKKIDASLAEIQDELAAIEKQLASLTRRKSVIEEEQKDLFERIEFETARSGMESLGDAPPESTVAWITGFVPKDELGHLKRAAAESGWALAAGDPAPDDAPPTLVRNNAFVRLIQPLFSFLGTIPGYKEYDISMSYLLFFCLFFAMIFGDAAYGTMLFIVTFLAGLRFKRKSGKFPDAVKLFMLLFGCTIVWGAVNGTWFSAPPEKLPGFLRRLIIPPFDNTGSLAAFPGFLARLLKLPADLPSGPLKTRWNIEFLCFTVGVIQLVLAHGKNIKKLLPSPVALAQLGWLIMMIGLYFLVLFMILHVELPPFAIYFIVCGLALYFIFAEQKGGNFLLNILKSFSNLLPTFLNAVSSFADIISYIRLFAVGLAGSAIASSFNSMAIPADGLGAAGLGMIFKILAMALILIFGHSLNMVMNALSVIVHGVRLNLLEYAGNHLGMEWSGYSYKPFAVKQKKD
jgi:V/A-type H+-transporting ATPase subunit I